MIELDEKLIDAATAIMGCSPGYLALMAEVLVEAGVKEGLTEDQAMRMVAQGDERDRRSARAPRARRAEASGRLARRHDRGGPRTPSRSTRSSETLRAAVDASLERVRE